MASSVALGVSPSPPASTPAVDLKRRAVRATVVGLAGLGLTQVVRLATNLVVSRLIAPEAYGLMTLVITLDVGLIMLSDLGTRISIINHRRGDEQRFLDTAFTIEVLRGVVLWLLAMAIATPWAYFYGDPRLRDIVLLYAVTALLNGAMSTKIGTLYRHMKVEWQVVMELTAMIAGSALSIGYAYFVEPSVWALVYGALFNTVVRFVMSHLALPGPINRFAWDRSAVKEIMSLGSWIFVSTLITFFAQRLDVLMMGALFTLDVVGVYNNANNLAGVPMLLGSRIIATVLLPALAAAGRDDRAALSRAYERGIDAAYMAGALVCLGVALIAPAFYALYDARYHEAGWIAQALMLVVWFGYMQESAGRALVAIGDARSIALANAVKLAVTAAGCFLGFRFGGLPLFMAGGAVGAAAGHAIIVWRLRARGLAAGRADLRYSAIAIGAGVVGALVPRVVAAELGVSLVVASLVAAVVIGGPAAAYVGRSLHRAVRAA